jgi:hypothetical protein
MVRLVKNIKSNASERTRTIGKCGWLMSAQVTVHPWGIERLIRQWAMRQREPVGA